MEEGQYNGKRVKTELIDADTSGMAWEGQCRIVVDGKPFGLPVPDWMAFNIARWLDDALEREPDPPTAPRGGE
jgi:hypothetical protein